MNTNENTAVHDRLFAAVHLFATLWRDRGVAAAARRRDGRRRDGRAAPTMHELMMLRAEHNVAVTRAHVQKLAATGHDAAAALSFRLLRDLGLEAVANDLGTELDEDAGRRALRRLNLAVVWHTSALFVQQKTQFAADGLTAIVHAQRRVPV